MGMLNNPWFRIKVHPVTRDGEQGLMFEHPTLAGNQPGGWMVRNKGDPSFTAPLVSAPLPSDSYVPALAESVKAPVVVSERDLSKPAYTMQDIKAHNNSHSSWFVVNNKVYDGTPFLKDHPGGSDSIILVSGGDATEDFDAIHSKKAWKMLEEYYIGDLIAGSESESEATDLAIEEEDSGLALNPRKKIPFKLIAKEKLSPDSFRLRFALQTSSTVLGLPVGQHMLFSAVVDKRLVMRAYTPTSSDHDIGFFDLVIKVYYANVSKEFPEGGKMSQYLGALKVGDSIDVKGPMGHVTYPSRGIIRVDECDFKVTSFVMLCGGTGITPIYQIISAVLRDQNDSTELHILYSNRHEVDILLKKELDELIAKYPVRLTMHYTLSSPPPEADWKHLTGRVDDSMIRQTLPKGSSTTFALMCGPPGLLDVCTASLATYGYDKDHIVYF